MGAVILTPLAILAWWFVGERVFGFEILTRPGSPLGNDGANVPVITVITVFISLFAWACVTRLFRDRTTRTGEIAWRVLRVGRTLLLWVGGGLLLTSLGISTLVSHYVHGNPMPPVWVALGAFCILAGPLVALAGLVPSYQILRYGRVIEISEIQKRPPRVVSTKEKRLVNVGATVILLALLAAMAGVVIAILQAQST